MIMSFLEYKNIYISRGKCIDQLSPPKNKFNEKQLQRRYDKFVIREEKKNNKPASSKKTKSSIKEKRFTFSDEEWKLTKEIAFTRDDLGECQFLKVLSYSEVELFFENQSFGLSKQVDPCHIFGRGAYPEEELAYNPSNIVYCNRIFHSLIDTNRNPLTTKPLLKGEKEKWWVRIIGEHRFSELNKIVKEINLKRRGECL